MNITINLNNMKYRYDIYQIINIFYPNSEISFVENDAQYDISIDDEHISIKKDGNIQKYSLVSEIQYKQNIRLAVYIYFSNVTGLEHPWGTMIGIRPAKIANMLIESGKDKESIVKHYYDHYLTSRQKALLCFDVAEVEKKYINNDIRNIAIYIGMPFCPTRCLYCSFASNAIGGKNSLVEQYLLALKYEIDRLSQYINSKNLKIESIYFGGGTPTSVNDLQFEGIMKSVHDAFVKGKDIKEFTVEAGRPDSINIEKLKIMKKYDVTRISINPQSMNDETLKRIGRLHSVDDVIEKFYMAREYGFNNINMDIIVGLPGEGIKEITNTCGRILELQPESLTVHGMSVKRGSKLHEQILNNKYSNEIGFNELYEMYELTRKTSIELGMHPYYLYRQKNMAGNMENIGYCKEGFENLYNMQIMEEKQVIIALGTDSVTKVVYPSENRIERYSNLKDIKEYINRIENMIEEKIKLLNTVF